MIVSFRDGVHPDGFAAWNAGKLAEAGVPAQRWPQGEEVAAEPVILARIDYGRWIVDCPFCTNANHADLEDLRFYCRHCQNERVGHRWLRVEVPENRLDIEASLEGVPVAMWSPGQALEDLAARPAPALSNEALQASAEDAWRARDELIEHTERLNRRIVELEAAVDAERRGAWAVIHLADVLRDNLEQERAFGRTLAASTQAPHPHEHN